MLRRVPGLLARWQTSDIHLRSPLQTRQYELLADDLAARAPGTVLDWGCGYGQISALLRERGVDVTSFDYRPDAPAEGGPLVLERFPDFPAFTSSDSVRLPFDDATFDTALSVGVLEHVQDPDGSLDELARVLKPGGKLYIYNLPNRTSWTEWIARRIGAHYHGINPYDKVYTRRTARELLQRHGYRVSDERYTGMLPQQLPFVPPPWLVRVLWVVNEALARVPGLNRLATAHQMVAQRPA
jgi:ubiquinone/menaquinone biosynthesis C-methylase UbiE